MTALPHHCPRCDARWNGLNTAHCGADEERVMAARRESFPELLERLGIDLSVTLVRDDTTNPVITYVPKEDQ